MCGSGSSGSVFVQHFSYFQDCTMTTADTVHDGIDVESTLEDKDDEFHLLALQSSLLEVPADQQKWVEQLVTSLDENDESPSRTFLQEQFEIYSEAIDKIARGVMPLQDLRRAWLKAEARQLLEGYIKMKTFTTRLGLSLKDLSDKHQRQMSLQVGSLPEMSQRAEEKVGKWLQALPTLVRETMKDEVLKKEWLASNLTDLLHDKRRNEQPQTPPRRVHSVNAGRFDPMTPEKLRPTTCSSSGILDYPVLKRPRVSSAADTIGFQFDA